MLIQKMNMKCDIYRDTGTRSSKMDTLSNYNSQWELEKSDVKCFIYDSSLMIGSYILKNSGLSQQNKFIGIFGKDEDVLVGDKITCEHFTGMEFLVEIVSPFVHPLTNKIHHLECILSVM